jgi:hypothetical protein
VNDAQRAAIAMGVDLPLFPSAFRLVCVGCSQAIDGEAHDTNDGWLCNECDEDAADDGPSTAGAEGERGLDREGGVQGSLGKGIGDVPTGLQRGG